MEIVAFLMANWEIISGAVALILTWHKDAIMNKLNIKSKKKEIEGSTSDIIEKNLKLYQTIIDDLEDRTSKRIDSLEGDVQEMREENDRLKSERDAKESEVSQLREEIHEIKAMLNKALKQLTYYQENSDLELPADLQ